MQQMIYVKHQSGSIENEHVSNDNAGQSLF